ncbi:hypothetical protein [Psychrobacter sp. AOP31-A1-22]|uniref:hypothetical protein n=1 Tax=Psychrobacter sp. AOP31-A1-22 TaxID=3457696 RepID=UPI004036BB8E
MKLFTNTSKTRLFATDSQVKNLEPIEITSVAQATEDWGHSVFNISAQNSPTSKVVG